MSVQVKICGIRSVMAARAAMYSGAKFLGFNFVPGSKRKITPAIAKQVIDEIKNQIKIVGVFQNQKAEEVNKIAEFLNLDYVQLHGDEDEAFIKEMERPVIKVLQLDPDFDITSALKEMNKYEQSFSLSEIEYFLLDRKKQGKGKMLNIKSISILCKTNPKIFIAGGLTPENVADVVRSAKPFGIDAASGIETNRLEDVEKIKKFTERAINA